MPLSPTSLPDILPVSPETIFPVPDWRTESDDEGVVWYDRPFGYTAYFPVTAFAEPALRSAVARYWTPKVRPRIVGHDDDGEFLWEDPQTDPLGDLLHKARREDSSGVRLRVLVDAYLNIPYAWEGEVSPTEIGRVFSIAHDIYRHVYSRDQNYEVPDALNAGFGTHTWGHTLEQLAWGRTYFVGGQHTRFGTIFFGINS